MPLDAFLLTLTAAALHAGWNLVVKSGSDRIMAALAVTAGAATLSVPVVVFVGPPSRDAIPFLVASAIVHTAYLLALTKAYERADFALAYPIARGSAPLLVTIGGVMFAGDELTVLGVVGVAIVATSILSLVQRRGGGQRVDAALITGLCIASYSVIDGKAVRVTGSSLRYVALLFVLHFAVLLGVIVVRRRGIPAVPDRFGLTMIVGGGASALAYLLVLIAVQDAPLGLVSGVRELSVIFGLIAGVVILGENVGRRHALAAVGAAAGAALIGLS